MPIVTVESGDEEVASDLAKRNALIRRSIREAVLRVSPQTSEDDVIVNFRKCITLVVDPKAADIWIDIDTCPGEMELRANDVADAVAALFPDWGFRASVRRAEVWGPKFHQGPWRAVEVSTGQVLDRVDHPVSRPAPTFDAYFKVVDHVVAQHSKFKLILQVINPVTGEALRLRSDSDEDLRAEYLLTGCRLHSPPKPTPKTAWARHFGEAAHFVQPGGHSFLLIHYSFLFYASTPGV